MLLFTKELSDVSKDNFFYYDQYICGIKQVGLDKVVATINDNEAAITKAQQHLTEPLTGELDTRKLIHFRCFNHVLNLLAHKTFELPRTSSELMKLVNEASKSIRASNILNGCFHRIAKKEGIKVSLARPGKLRTN